eukprot:SAG31_NODE_3337_length_4388_cov_3.372814_2_plen_242_part_00
MQHTEVDVVRNGVAGLGTELGQVRSLASDAASGAHASSGREISSLSATEMAAELERMRQIDASQQAQLDSLLGPGGVLEQLLGEDGMAEATAQAKAAASSFAESDEQHAVNLASTPPRQHQSGGKRATSPAARAVVSRGGGMTDSTAASGATPSSPVFESPTSSKGTTGTTTPLKAGASLKDLKHWVEETVNAAAAKLDTTAEGLLPCVAFNQQWPFLLCWRVLIFHAACQSTCSSGILQG